MKLFTPKIRRSVVELIHFKGGFISELTWRLADYDDLKIGKNKLTLKTRRLDWKHESFIKDCNGYTRSIRHSPPKKVNIIQDATIVEQQEILDELIECSKEFSSFISGHIKLKDIALR